MIKNPTTFVLGAGSSVEYGFPLGKTLVDWIENWERRSPERFSQFNRPDLNLRGLSKTLNNDPSETIDAFLEQHDEFIREGKYAITSVLSSMSSEDYLSNKKWYNSLWQKLSREPGEGKMESPHELSDENKVNFITFNYDLSLETFLWNRIEARFPNVNKKEKIEAINKIKILHIHGKIDTLPWEPRTIPPVIKKTGPGMPTFGDPNAALSMSENIVLAHESRAENNAFEAQRIIERSNNVIFLGFGFHQSNKRKLAGEGTPFMVVDKYPPYFNPETNDVVNRKKYFDTGFKTYTFKNSLLSTSDIEMTEAVRRNAKQPGYGLDNIKFYKGTSIAEIFEQSFDEMIQGPTQPTLEHE